MARGTGLLLLFTALIGAAVPTVAGADALSATGAWVREAPPGRSVSAAYVEFRNDGDAPVVLVSASSSGAERVEFHSSVEEDGMMRMRRVERIEVPAHGSIAFAPGGLHLMLFGTAAPRAGERLDLDFETAQGETLTVTFPVRSALAATDTPGATR